MKHCETCTCKPPVGERRRRAQDPAIWPPSMTAEEIELSIDNVCGCAGRNDCDRVSSFNQALSGAWYNHNTA